MTELRTEYVALGVLVPAVRNPKLHAEAEIVASIRRFGFVEPVLRDERTGRLIAGHGRLEALQALEAEGGAPPWGIVAVDGWRLPVVFGWSSKDDAEAEALLIAVNQLPPLGGWDSSMLASMLEDVSVSPLGLEGTGFTAEDLASMMADATASGRLPSVYRPELPAARVDSPQVRVLAGDCIEQLQALEEGSVDAVVTDPPYGLEFMGNEWDSFRVDDRGARWSGDGVPMEMRAFQNWCEQWAVEVLRVLKPGGFLLAFGGSRTHHRLTCALEEVGFEIRDSIEWVYSSGFPKSLDVSKAIDDRLGNDRPDRQTVKGSNTVLGPTWSVLVAGAPVAVEAARWWGWGTALKPAHEPIVVARKLPNGSVAANVLEHGVGGLNVAATRVALSSGEAENYEYGVGALDEGGRWPPNLVFSHDPDCTEVLGCVAGCPVAELNREVAGVEDGDARFFPAFRYESKPSVAERDAGLEELVGENGRSNSHPTVKPLALMRWLVRLVTPPGGVVLEPFAGSGTTLAAAVLEGFDAIGVEREEKYLPLVEGRVAWAQGQRVPG